MASRKLSQKLVRSLFDLGKDADVGALACIGLDDSLGALYRESRNPSQRDIASAKLILPSVYSLCKSTTRTCTTLRPFSSVHQKAGSRVAMTWRNRLPSKDESLRWNIGGGKTCRHT